MGPTPAVLVCGLAVGGVLSGPRSMAEGQRAPYRRLAGVGEEAASVTGAVQGARKRLADGGCRRVLEDFTDAAGRTLQQNLDVLALSPAEYLDRIVFYDGAEAGRCRSASVLAMTMPGSRAVIVCGPRFAAARRNDARLAEVVVIHEMLHSLGLGENPPSAREITAQVFARCGR